MSNNTLIQPQEVVGGAILKTSPTTARFDPIIIAPFIQEAELVWLKPVICADLYADMITEKDGLISNYNTDTTDCPLQEAFPNNANYEALWVGYLLPFISKAVIHVALPNIAFKTASKGVYSTNSQYAQSAGIQELKYLQQCSLETLTVLKQNIIDFLCKNKADYPLFCDDCHCECDCGTCDDCNDNPIYNNLFISYK